jgi:signal peptidase I
MLMQIIVLLSWLAIPAGLIAVIDDWFLRPRRQAAAKTLPLRDPPLMSLLYLALPVFIGAAVLRLLVAERLDFSLVLFLITAVTGVIWWIDVAVFRPQRNAAAAATGKDPSVISEPGTVDYARSFFPVALIVLLLRSFVFEPFRIPSDSMMPTLLDGDFIIVNKYAYGLRLPVVNRKVVSIGEPKRGDVVVFRFPRDPSINYIKRLVGKPGDRVSVRGDQLIVNGEALPLTQEGSYTDGCYVGMRLAVEKLGAHTHQVLSCRSSRQLISARSLSFAGNPRELPAVCDRQRVVEEYGAFICDESNPDNSPDSGDFAEIVVPAGHYLMIGDNRDNSLDSRAWGLVPDENIVGKATRIWFNLDPQRSSAINWGRIGDGIE